MQKIIASIFLAVKSTIRDTYGNYLLQYLIKLSNKHIFRINSILF